RRAELLDQAITQYQNAAPKARIEFAVWLNQNGEFERTLAALPIAEARTRKDFFLPHIDALASLGRWPELLKLFETKPMPLEPPRPAFQELERITELSSPTRELRDLLGEMVRRWPNEVALQNDHAYLNLLLGTELAASRQTAELLMKQFPESLPYRTTFALA